MKFKLLNVYILEIENQCPNEGSYCFRFFLVPIKCFQQVHMLLS